LINFID